MKRANLDTCWQEIRVVNHKYFKHILYSPVYLKGKTKANNAIINNYEALWYSRMIYQAVATQ